MYIVHISATKCNLIRVDVHYTTSGNNVTGKRELVTALERRRLVIFEITGRVATINKL